MKLASYAGGTDNNFHLVRILAAFAVLVTHSFALSTGSADAEPFRLSLGMTLGSVSVDIFFIVSGFLVTGSLLKTQSAIAFFWARVLRIYPALIAMLVLLVFVLGILFTSLPVLSYLTTPKTYVYFLKCATLVTGVSWTLPGVFHSNPMKDAVNGSLWTMPYELYMYGIVLGAWLVLRVRVAQRTQVFKLAVVTAMAASGVLLLLGHLAWGIEIESWFIKLFFMFFSGAGFYVMRERIQLSRVAFWICVLALVASSQIDRQLFFAVYVLTLAYVLFYLVYVPAGVVRQYNRLGDYSYGMYIYAFPIQQTVAALIPGVSVLAMVLYSTAGTLFMAVLSWHLLEKRALGLRGLFTQQTRARLQYR
ncbi:MAG: acyltransferase [Pseudomonadota bacterium]